MSSGEIHRRKDEHLRVVRESDVNSHTPAGWDTIRLPHLAAPDLDINEVRLETSFLGAQLRAPVLISSMTGGTPDGEEVNRRLARFAERHGFAMGVGSQRVQLVSEDREVFSLRKVAPKAVLFSNIGLVQLNYGVKAEDCQRVVERLEAQAIFFHLNALQEAIQPEGDRNFAGLWGKIAELRKKISVPMILKEVGSGLDPETCRRAFEAGFDAVDIAGLGGTHWGYIEGLRRPERRRLGEIFRDWGLPTAEALQGARRVLPPHYPVIASGGLRDGLDAARALYLGADVAGFAAPFLRAAASDEGLEAMGFEIYDTLRIALFCTGSRTPRELRERGPFPVKG